MVMNSSFSLLLIFSFRHEAGDEAVGDGWTNPYFR